MKYCIKCGTKLPDEAVFCIKCGENVTGNSNEPRTESQVNNVVKSELEEYQQLLDEGIITESEFKAIEKKLQAVTDGNETIPANHTEANNFSSNYISREKNVKKEGVYCRNCGEVIDEKAVICPYCGVPQNSNGNQIMHSQGIQEGPVDNGSFGWAVLGFFIPIAGLILYLVWKNEKPKTAKNAGIGALVGFVFNLIIAMMFL